MFAKLHSFIRTIPGLTLYLLYSYTVVIRKHLSCIIIVYYLFWSAQQHKNRL